MSRQVVSTVSTDPAQAASVGSLRIAEVAGEPPAAPGLWI